MIHRTCQTALAETERALREAQDRAYRLGERLTSELEAAAGREADLRREIHDLQCRVNDLEEEDSSHQSVLEARRRRAAEAALEPAWQGAWHDSAGNRAHVAQALLALPLASYDVAVAYQRDGNGTWFWSIDGRSVPTRHRDYGSLFQEEVLTGRYGFTEAELGQIRRDGHRADRQLTKEAF